MIENIRAKARAAFEESFYIKFEKRGARYHLRPDWWGKHQLG